MILVECKPDKALIKFLLNEISSKRIKCVGGKSEVIKNLSKSNHQLLMKYPQVIGLTDEDPGKPVPRVFSEYEVIETLPIEDIVIYRHKINKRYIISLIPRLEEWVIKTAIDESINLEKFNLPKDSNSFHDIINASLDDYQRLLLELKENKRLLCLKEIITDLYFN